MENENLRFECAFSKKAMKSNAVTLIVYTIVMTMILGYISWNASNTRLSIWLIFFYIVFIILISVIGMISERKLAKGSYMELTSDGMLRCKFKGSKEVSYPIKEIRSIEESSLKDAEKKYATFPTVLNIRGEELYPPTGVLITFNRAWIKSVFPVYFNPEDISGFISAIRKRIKPAEEDHKFEEKVDGLGKNDYICV